MQTYFMYYYICYSYMLYLLWTLAPGALFLFRARVLSSEHPTREAQEAFSSCKCYDSCYLGMDIEQQES